MLEHPPLYPLNSWQIIEDQFILDNILQNETIFALGNGYLGIRATFEEGLPGKVNGTMDGIYINGFYESVPIPHAEKGYGYAINTQTMLNVTDSKIIELYLEGERFSMDSGTVINYKRILDMKKGFMTREVTWRSPRGRDVEIKIQRLVSFNSCHLIAFKYEVRPLNFSGPITIRSGLNGDVDNNIHEEEDPRFTARLKGLGLEVTDLSVEGTHAVISQKTKRSGLYLACSMENHLCGKGLAGIEREQKDDQAAIRFRIEGRRQKKITFEKYAAYYTSLDEPVEKLSQLALETVTEAKNKGFQELLKDQKEFFREYWENAGLNLSGDLRAEQGLRFNLFHLMQGACTKGGTGISAKGLTSEGYDGHYFWDTEIYMVPFFSALFPDLARKLLEFRYSILDYARSRARDLSHYRGALYPWRTIAGEEGSSYYPASTAQYHINAAIAYAISKYIEVTGDFSFMLDCGAEIIFETARLWEDLGAYIPSKGNLFCYNEVTGPDEYTALVSNNCYTNLMARWHLNYAHQTARLLKKEHPETYRRLVEKLDLKEAEVEDWQIAAEAVYIPYDDNLKVHPQDDSFFDKELWDFSTTPPGQYPLLLFYHPLVIYRYQVCKQPDVILAQLLLGDDFTLEQKQRNYQYYEPITTHDSSLSPSIFSIAASELGYSEDAYRFFTMAARLDLDNIFRDTYYGVHMANMAGSWLSLAQGFAGMRTAGKNLRFKPYLPHNLQSYRFRVAYQGSRLEIAVTKHRVTYTLLKGESVEFKHAEESVSLASGESASYKLEKQ